jgi:hypothetical protein
MSKEQFREITFKKAINVKYTDGNGAENRWTADPQKLLADILSIVKSYEFQGIKLTNRQLYYQLVAGGLIPNADMVYKRICTFLTDARYAGLVDWRAIEDRGRNIERHSEWDDVKELVESAVASYRLPRWSDQENYVEMFVEKQAMESVLQPIASQYHIFFGANKGYSSASTMYELAQRLKAQIEEGRFCYLLYFGDHDASGLDMIRDIRERIEEFLTKGDFPVMPNFEVVPLALNMAQIKQYNPPPNPAKITDPRAKWYIEKYGQNSWELDALNPKILRDLATQGILEYIDIDKYDAWIRREKKEIIELRKFAERMIKSDKKPRDKEGDG